MRFNKDKVKGFVTGMLTTALFASLMGTAFAASGTLKSIKVVEGGIKLFVEGQLVKPLDASGNIVEPFIYDGTTYLPLRALSNALTKNEKPVKWDPDTSSIYVGQAPVAAQTDIAELEVYNTDGKVYKETNYQILDKKVAIFNGLDSNSYYTYILHSNYSVLNGQFIVPYTRLGDNDTSSLKFYSVDKKGNETLLKEYATSAGDETTDVDVNISGVEILKIKVGSRGVLYNTILTGIK
ncbi:hypothetical protein B9T62_35885 [Paenibacillus donghaensis]|uniref:Copper amine oxidase-like N-terminal domain-containing protein n=2 Tax=Paenibacillus donghaensis TaxID=414771 RepID=A0A2Z2KPK7_9BACL|nr:hypothetical protein B9T62_35885 [Paenibacillus donghaensis]